LLQHHYASSILNAPALESGLLHEATPVAEGPGDTIGRYKLLERIGERKKGHCAANVIPA